MLIAIPDKSEKAKATFYNVMTKHESTEHTSVS